MNEFLNLIEYYLISVSSYSILGWIVCTLTNIDKIIDFKNV